MKKIMIDEIMMTFPDLRILLLAGCLLVLGLIMAKGKRKLFFVPAVIITVVVINPVFYDLWYRFNDRAYWRMLWIVPIVIVCALVPSLVVDKLKNDLLKSAVLFVGVLLFAVCGTFVYGTGTIIEATNADKLPEDVVKTAEALLELDEEPYVVADPSISRYIRQYSGKIKTLFARDVDWSLNSSQAEMVYHNLYSNLDVVKQTMLDYDYKYLITLNMEEERRQSLENAGAEKIEQISSYGIYRVKGERTQVRKYNNHHQIVEITYVNEDGVPADNQQGYAKVEYKYNTDNQIVSISYFDINANLVNTGDGFAKIEYQYPDGFKKPLDYYYRADGSLLERGRGYLHHYLQLLKPNESIIFISVYDEASSQLSNTIIEDMRRLGLRESLKEKYRYSYYAVVTSGYLKEEIGKDQLCHEGNLGEISYRIESCGGNTRTGSSIIINGREYSPNQRGLNIVVYDKDKKKVVDMISFDTYDSKIMTYRKN